MNVDDLLLIYHHRERVQHALLILLNLHSARPGIVVQFCGYRGSNAYSKDYLNSETIVTLHASWNSNNCLEYKDIEIFKVRDPENPSVHILIMKVRRRLMKGKRSKGAPPIIVFYERDE